MKTRRHIGTPRCLLAGAIVLLAADVVQAQANDHAAAPLRRSITDTSLDWPDVHKIIEVLTLTKYNTRVVVIGTSLLGIAAGVIGTFAYLRKRAMMGDALSHATLPGIALAFILTTQKSLPFLISGAAATGVLGVLSVIALRRFSRIKEDAAIGVVLSVFFGAGMVLFSLIQQMHTGQEAGMQTFIYGQAAAMIRRDAWLIAGAALIVILGTALLYKEFRAVCFDAAYAGAQGWPVILIDILMMSMVVLTTVIGLQAVGLIMIVALLIIPAAAARFWTDSLGKMTVLAGLFGALSGWLGSSVSALAPRLPAGAIIVVCAGIIFAASMLVAPQRGIIAGVLRRWSLRRKIVYQHLLRAFAEIEEQTHAGCAVTKDQLIRKRSWTALSLARVLNRARAAGDVVQSQDGYGMTPEGRRGARRVLRNHRLWEIYLIKHADIAPSHVDRDADEVEHVLSAPLIRELEQALEDQAAIPPSPHAQGVAR